MPIAVRMAPDQVSYRKYHPEIPPQSAPPPSPSPNKLLVHRCCVLAEISQPVDSNPQYSVLILHARLPTTATVLCKLVGTLKVLASSTCSNYSTVFNLISTHTYHSYTVECLFSYYRYLKLQSFAGWLSFAK